MASEQATAAAKRVIKNFDLCNTPVVVHSVASIIDAAFAPVVAERDALRETVKEYCDFDEIGTKIGSSCFTKDYIDEIRKRHGIE